MLELLLFHHGELAKHELRVEISFKFELWKLVSNRLGSCTFASPLASLGHKDKLRAADLLTAFNHIDRCSHFHPPNVRASRHRKTLSEEIETLKREYVQHLQEQGVPPAVIRIFALQRLLVDWFSTGGDEDSQTSFLFAGDEGDDPLSSDAASQLMYEAWLAQRKITWKAIVG